LRIETHEEKYQPPVETERTSKIVLSKEEYDYWLNVFIKGKWGDTKYLRKDGYPAHMQKIVLRGGYKWMPSDVELDIQIENNGQKEKVKA
jgi:hypothetical protein